MRQLIPAIGFWLMLNTSCNSERQNADNSVSEDVTTTTDTVVVSSPESGEYLEPKSSERTNFIAIDSTKLLIFPQALFADRNMDQSFYRNASVFYWNILFFHPPSEQTHLLSTDKMLVSYDHSIEDKKLGALFFRIRNEDVNKNGTIDPKDPEGLFCTDLYGKNLRRISPEGLHLKEWNYVDSTGHLILQLVKDVDGNHKYDQSDGLVWYQAKLDREPIATPLVAPGLARTINALKTKQWPAKTN